MRRIVIVVLIFLLLLLTPSAATGKQAGNPGQERVTQADTGLNTAALLGNGVNLLPVERQGKYGRCL